jgi:hypothetical protein
MALGSEKISSAHAYLGKVAGTTEPPQFFNAPVSGERKRWGVLPLVFTGGYGWPNSRGREILAVDL